MNVFFDTNVIVGHIYSIDSLNKDSKKVIIKKNINYYSYHVKEEVKKVCRRKNREYDSFLGKVSKIINKSDDNSLIDISKIHNEIRKFSDIGELDVKKMHFAIETIWHELKFDENTDAFKVKSNFDDYWNNFNSKHLRHMNHCFNNMNCIPAYNQKDPIVLNKIEEKNLRKNYLHGADEDILFDVHYYLINNLFSDFLFVSDDGKFIYAISELIDVLSFNNYKYLKDFSNNS